MSRPPLLSLRALPALLVGALLGATLIDPAVAHVGNRLSHLAAHFDARYVRAAGVSAVPVLDGWVAPDGLTARFDGVATHFSGTPNGTNSPTLSLTPTLPAALYGKKMKVTGVEICANFSSANIEQANVTLAVFSSIDPGGAGGSNVVDDSTPHDGSVCRMYRGTPLVLEENGFVKLGLRVNYSGAATWYIQRTTFFMATTRFAATLPPAS